MDGIHHSLAELRAGTVYLATPYSSRDPALMEHRWRAVSAFAAMLETNGITTISPVTQNRMVAQIGCIPEDWETWKTSCLRLLASSDIMLILPCAVEEGAIWRSTGVQSEIHRAHQLRMTACIWDWSWKRFSWTSLHQEKHEAWLQYRSIPIPSSDRAPGWSTEGLASTPPATPPDGRSESGSGSETSQDSEQCRERQEYGSDSSWSGPGV